MGGRVVGSCFVPKSRQSRRELFNRVITICRIWPWLCAPPPPPSRRVVVDMKVILLSTVFANILKAPVEKLTFQGKLGSRDDYCTLYESREILWRLYLCYSGVLVLKLWASSNGFRIYATTESMTSPRAHPRSSSS